MHAYIKNILHKREGNAYGYGHHIYELRTRCQEDEGDQKGRDGLPRSKGHVRRAGAFSGDESCSGVMLIDIGSEGICD